MAVLPVSGFDRAFCYMANCRSSDVDCPRCTSSWFPYDLSMGGPSDHFSGGLSLMHRCNADGELIGYCMLQVCSVFRAMGPHSTTYHPDVCASMVFCVSSV